MNMILKGSSYIFHRIYGIAFLMIAMVGMVFAAKSWESLLIVFAVLLMIGASKTLQNIFGAVLPKFIPAKASYVFVIAMIVLAKLIEISDFSFDKFIFM